jgi:pimeloyl-ACP methyl ester carboxylesterase
VPATVSGAEGEPAEVAVTSKRTCVDGLQIHYRASKQVHSDGCLSVVLVHGLKVSSRCMVPTLKRLSRHCRIYALELPGFGIREKLARVLNMAGSLTLLLHGWML